MAQETTTTPPKKYTEEERERVRGRLQELVAKGLDNHEIAQIMNEEGYRAPSGEPLKHTTVCTQIMCCGGRKKIIKRAERRALTPPSRRRGPRLIARPESAETPRVTTRITHVSSLGNKRQAPAFVMSTLTDPELSETEIVSMLRTYYR